MPSRIIRDGILSSERVALLGWAEECFYRRLHSVVDDYGRFHAHNSLLRAACYPLLLDKVSDSDVGKWLTACVNAALVRVYPALDGKRYLEVQDFGQRIQAKSKFPGPIGDSPEPTVGHGEPPEVTALVGVEDEDDKSGSAPAGAEAPPRRSDPIPYQAIVDAYNATLTGLPKVREINGDRKTAIRREWRVSAQRRSLAFWQAYFDECQDDGFLNGAGPYREPHANWRPTFDYLLRAEVVVKVFERAMDRLDREDKA